MATWVNVNRAAKFPEVMKVYKRGGTGQGVNYATTQPWSGNPPNSAPRGFLETVRFIVSQNTQALPAWIRKSPLGSNDWQDCQVDVTAIPGVRPLTTGGKWTRFGR